MHLRRLRAERAMQRGVQLLVRPVVGAADHVRDPEVDVVDDAREMERRRAVVAPERDALEALRQPGLARRREVALGALALPHRPVVPLDPEPAQVLEDRLLAAGHVARRVGVVDPQQQPVAEAAVRHRAQRVADVQRPGRARSEADAHHQSVAATSSKCVDVLPSSDGRARAARRPCRRRGSTSKERTRRRSRPPSGSRCGRAPRETSPSAGRRARRRPCASPCSCRSRRRSGGRRPPA